MADSSSAPIAHANRMQVIARVRPLNSSESKPVVYVKQSDSPPSSTTPSTPSTSTASSSTPSSTTIIGVNLDQELTATKSSKEYSLDLVFPESTTQQQVFDGVIPLMRSALSGFNTTIFTYGQTGTGKTHTMLGHDLWEDAASNLDSDSDSHRHSSFLSYNNKNDDTRGIIPRALQYVFNQINIMVNPTNSSPNNNPAHTHTTNSVTVSLSYTEIYNEQVRDLLAVKAVENTTITVQGVGAAALTPSKGASRSYFGHVENNEKSLEIREDKKLGIIIPNLTEVTVSTDEEVFNVLWKGARNRAMASTNMNERSSRSHTIFGVRLTVSMNGIVRRSKINLVDLAGSERYKTHQMARFSEQRIKELTSINQSLSALGNCISALTKKNSTSTHVPYRNSKLTRLLQDSLGGNTRTMFIVTVSPSAISADETVSTLQFADRAMRVRVFATSNEILSDDDPLKRAHHEIARLKSLLQASIARQKLTKPSESAGGGGGATAAKNGKSMNMQMVERMDAEAQAEAATLRDENLKLAEEISRLREALVREKNEKAKLLKAIYRGEGGGDWSDEEQMSEEIDHVFGRQQPDDDNVSNEDDDVGNSISVNHTAQLRVMLAQRSMLAQRQEEIEATARDQDEQREWLDSYHTWLRNLPVSENHSTANPGESPTLYDRLCMMETSVLLQSQELKRTKRLFLRDKDRLERQISEGMQAVEERDIMYSEIVNGNVVIEEENEGLKIEVDDLKATVAKLKLEMMKGRKVGFSAESSIRHSSLDNSVITDSPLATKKGFNFTEELNGVTSGGDGGGGATGKKLEELKVSGGRVRKQQQQQQQQHQHQQQQQKQQPTWTKHMDQTHGVHYYHNAETNETVWERPEGYNSP